MRVLHSYTCENCPDDHRFITWLNGAKPFGVPFSNLCQTQACLTHACAPWASVRHIQPDFLFDDVTHTSRPCAYDLRPFRAPNVPNACPCCSFSSHLCQLLCRRIPACRSKRLQPVPVCDFLLAGPVCSSRSRLNNSRRDFARCVQEGSGSTGATFQGTFGHLRSRQPLCGIIENIVELKEGGVADLEEGPSQWQLVSSLLFAIFSVVYAQSPGMAVHCVRSVSRAMQMLTGIALASATLDQWLASQEKHVIVLFASSDLPNNRFATMRQ